MIGTVYLLSMIYLSAVVIGVYTAARDLNEEKSKIFKNLIRRTTQLVGVLAGLALIVFFLGLF